MSDQDHEYNEVPGGEPINHFNNPSSHSSSSLALPSPSAAPSTTFSSQSFFGSPSSHSGPSTSSSADSKKSEGASQYTIRTQTGQ